MSRSRRYLKRVVILFKFDAVAIEKTFLT